MVSPNAVSIDVLFTSSYGMNWPGRTVLSIEVGMKIVYPTEQLQQARRTVAYVIA
jgi:hypothetical protein